MPSKKNIKYTIGRSEFEPGTAEARKFVIPVTEIGGLDKHVERGEDPAIVGSNMLTGEYPIAFGVDGPIPLSPRPCGALGVLLKGLLGTEEIPVRIGGIMRVRYTGAQASCLLVSGSDRTHGIQECGLAGKTETTATGLVAATAYSFKVNVDGGGLVEYNITTGTRLTYDAVMRLMNEALANVGAYFHLVGGDLRCTSQAMGVSSTIVLAAGVTNPDLFAALTGWIAFDAAVDGIAGVAIALSSSIGAKGAEAPDANFGVAGSYDLTLAANDTFGELVALINTDTDYEAEILFGAAAQDTQQIITFVSQQGAARWVYMLFVGNTSTGFAHVFTPDLTDTERPSYSIQKDGFQDNFLYSGCAIDGMSFNAAKKAMADGSVDILGLTEGTGTGASGLTLEDVDPLIYGKGSFMFGGIDYDYLRKITVVVHNNSDPEGYGIASLYRAYVAKGFFGVDGDFSIRLDANTYAERTKTFDGTVVGMSFLFQGKAIETNVPEIMIVELPYCALSLFEFEENDPVIDAHMGYKVLNPKGTNYNDPVRMIIVTTDGQAY